MYKNVTVITQIPDGEGCENCPLLYEESRGGEKCGFCKCENNVTPSLNLENDAVWLELESQGQGFLKQTKCPNRAK